MIKINLAKVRKEKPEKAVVTESTALKGLRIGDLLKAGGEYYVGVVLWAGVLAVLGYHWKINREREALKAELDNLNAEKTRLQTEAKKFLDEKEAVENRIATLKKEIQDLEKSMDIIVGLKAYYDPFNTSFYFYTRQVPKTSWVSSYRQSLDINQQKLTSELEINSFDYNSLSSYGKAISIGSQKASLAQLERKVNPHGFEYYSAKLSSERSLQEGR